MDWDDDDEATHVFDKDKGHVDPAEFMDQQREPERASMDAIMSSPPPPRTSAPPPAAGTPPPATTATLSGAFASLGQKTNGSTGGAQFRSGPPPSQSLRAAPPPPPPSMPGRNPSTTTAPVPPPPPPPPGQTVTAPMHMPVPAPPAAPPPAPNAQTMPSMQSPVPPRTSQPPSQPPVQMPPVSRAMEATALVHRPQPNRTPLILGLVAVMAIAAAAVFFLMPRPGTLAVNVADAKGAAISKLEIHVDGTKRCDSAPCIVREVAPGVHEVKVIAQGYEPAAPRAITIDRDRRDVSTDFQLVASKAAGGTGFKVAGNQPGVKLNVDGKDIGPLPQEVRDLEPGEHKLKFAGSERYAPQEKTVSIAKDEIVDLGNIQLKVVKGKATIELGTPGAKVYLVLGTNRKEVPQFPMGIEFNPNERWELQATKDGFDEFRQPIAFDDGQAEKTFNVTLTPKGAAMAAAPHNGAANPIQPVVATPKTATPTAATPKEPAEKPEPASKPEPAAAKKEPAAPAAGGGSEAFLNINSLPASTVLLDGKPLGPTPKLKVSVPPGDHTITFVNAEQSLKKSITVKVAAGETKAAFAKLRAE